MQRRTMRKRWTWPLGLALVGAALYGGTVERDTRDRSRVHGHDAGQRHLRVDRLPRGLHALEAALARDDQDARELGPLRATEHVGPRCMQRLHPQHGLAHASRAQPRDRHPRHRDGLRRRRSEVHAARVHGEHAEQLVRRSGRRARAHHPRRERRAGADDRSAAHPGRCTATAGRPHQSGQLPVLSLESRLGGAVEAAPPNLTSWPLRWTTAGGGGRPWRRRAGRRRRSGRRG